MNLMTEVLHNCFLFYNACPNFDQISFFFCVLVGMGDLSILAFFPAGIFLGTLVKHLRPSGTLLGPLGKLVLTPIF